MNKSIFEDVDIEFLQSYLLDMGLDEESNLSELVEALQNNDRGEQSQREIIDQFLQCKRLKIVLDESLELDESISELETVEITAADKHEIASEELAKIYRDQGLYSRAIDIYRQLSLLNSEKSVYFAEQIEQTKIIRDNKQKNS